MLDLPPSIEKKTMKLGIEDVQKVYACLDSPADFYSTIHVGGTNGKGSVCYKIASALQKKGFKVGLFSSPHILCPTERISINGKCIPKNQLEEYFEQLDRLSYFERMTLAAFLYFKEQKVDWAVIEVGLGGRLDATNVIKPKVCAITSIGYDHTHILGETLEKIAFEKAGIIKAGVPVVFGPRTTNVLPEIAEERGAPYVSVLPQENYQKENECVAQEVLAFLGFEKEPLPQLPPCRYEMIVGPKPTILDVAHNLPGFQALFKKLNEDFPRKQIGVIAGFSKDKDIEALLDFIQKKACCFYPLSFEGERSYFTNSPPFEKSYAKACAQSDVVLIGGSFFVFAKSRWGERLLSVR
jgi:dihydrofolate synthase / folylpolyglutamate synthase